MPCSRPSTVAVRTRPSWTSGCPRRTPMKASSPRGRSANGIPARGCWFCRRPWSRPTPCGCWPRTPARSGYLLKERVADVATLVDALHRVTSGESVVDPAIVQRLLAQVRHSDPLDGLTEREREVLAAMAEGRSNQGIAARLFLSDRTIETHVSRIFTKLDLAEVGCRGQPASAGRPHLFARGKVMTPPADDTDPRPHLPRHDEGPANRRHIMRAARTPPCMALIAAGAMARRGVHGRRRGQVGSRSPPAPHWCWRPARMTSRPFPESSTSSTASSSLSSGRMTIRVAPRWGAGEDEVDVLEDVAAGKADFGSTGTRALDQVGVRGLTPLNAPFLVDSYAGQKAVLADRTVTQHLDGLREAGLVGVALIADNLRVPVGTAGPLLGAEDYSHAMIRTPRSDVQSSGLRALGARPSSNAFDETMDGAEVSWDNDVGAGAYFAKFVTANTPLWPRSLVLVANPASLDRLSGQQREWVRAAASDAARWSLDHARDGEATRSRRPAPRA